MQKYLIYSIYFIQFIFPAKIFSQEIKDSTARWWKNKDDAWYISVALGLNLNSIEISREFNYSGEYFNNYGSQFGNSGGSWEWKNIYEKRNNYTDTFNLRVMQYDLLISPFRRVHFGLNYSFNLLVEKFAEYTQEYFICINGKLEYQHPLFNNEDFYLFGTLTLGNYQSDEFNEGPGRETALGFTAGLGHVFWKGFFYRIYLADMNLFYRNYSESRVFNKKQTDEIDWRFLYLGFDIGRRYKLVPDKE
ncbi:MAG: hypothetical protein A3H98_13525 [Bacteroidetes bacterium RIFCSPLOWO2_02_FULL_36_8]|nr:MAG: hypothetical protein A3H98_13525 [Bacteroidetes bacterium RIFCSPLOWO2_02_FULL_36_8]OFY71777.1 MAG: hypothetical protein A3G23_13745 [Bacteroidetes bacterium RIFCSPLOWO2_12_FULL_37_12]